MALKHSDIEVRSLGKPKKLICRRISKVGGRELERHKVCGCELGERKVEVPETEGKLSMER